MDAYMTRCGTFTVYEAFIDRQALDDHKRTLYYLALVSLAKDHGFTTKDSEMRCVDFIRHVQDMNQRAVAFEDDDDTSNTTHESMPELVRAVAKDGDSSDYDSSSSEEE